RSRVDRAGPVPACVASSSAGRQRDRCRRRLHGGARPQRGTTLDGASDGGGGPRCGRSRHAHRRSGRNGHVPPPAPPRRPRGVLVLAQTADLVTAAAAAGRAVAAFNVITVEHAEAIAEGAERAGHPVILQISQNAVRYHGGRLGPIAAATAAIAASSAVPAAV